MRLSPFSLKFPLSAGLRDLRATLSGRLSWRPKSSDAVQPLAQPPAVPPSQGPQSRRVPGDRKSTRLNSSHGYISYAVLCSKKKNRTNEPCGLSIVDQKTLDVQRGIH